MHSAQSQEAFVFDGPLRRLTADEVHSFSQSGGDNVTPVVRRVLGAEREWRGHVTVVTAEGIRMIQARGRRRNQ